MGYMQELEAAIKKAKKLGSDGKTKKATKAAKPAKRTTKAKKPDGRKSKATPQTTRRTAIGHRGDVPTGKCPSCEERLPLTDKGMLKAHERDDTGKICGGSGYPPLGWGKKQPPKFRKTAEGKVAKVRRTTDGKVSKKGERGSRGSKPAARGSKPTRSSKPKKEDGPAKRKSRPTYPDPAGEMEKLAGKGGAAEKRRATKIEKEEAAAWAAHEKAGGRRSTFDKFKEKVLKAIRGE
jgi:hypothetical protein